MSAAEADEHRPFIDNENLPAPTTGFVVTQFITVRSVARSRAFYSEVLGGQVVLEENPCIVKLANSWILMNPGGPPTPDKPDISVVNYEPGNTVSSFLNLRVADIQACYEQWSAKGAEFVTPPIDRGAEIRCYMRDPDGYTDRSRPVHRTAPRRTRREAAGRPARLRGSPRNRAVGQAGHFCDQTESALTSVDVHPFEGCRNDPWRVEWRFGRVRFFASPSVRCEWLAAVRRVQRRRSPLHSPWPPPLFRLCLARRLEDPKRSRFPPQRDAGSASR